jgi:hypothetical protein
MIEKQQGNKRAGTDLGSPVACWSYFYPGATFCPILASVRAQQRGGGGARLQKVKTRGVTEKISASCRRSRTGGGKFEWRHERMGRAQGIRIQDNDVDRHLGRQLFSLEIPVNNCKARKGYGWFFLKGDKDLVCFCRTCLVCENFGFNYCSTFFFIW